MSDKPNKSETLFTVRVKIRTLKEFYAAADMKGSDASGLVRGFMIDTIHKERDRNSAGFDETMSRLAEKNGISPPPPGSTYHEVPGLHKDTLPPHQARARGSKEKGATPKDIEREVRRLKGKKPD